METVDTPNDIISNIFLFNSYRYSERNEERDFYTDRLRLGKIFVVLHGDQGMMFCPSRFAGYKGNSMEKHVAFEDKSGSVTTPKISSVLNQEPENISDLEKKYLYLCGTMSIKPSNIRRRYWLMQKKKPDYDQIDFRISAGSGYPDKIKIEKEYSEGATKQVLVNAFERNPEARKACIAHYGYNCSVCEMNFQEEYGEIGKEFIHVHHLSPLALRKDRYEIDPIKDLRPVCPNCHAMLHRSDPPFTIEELREIIDL